MAKYFNRFKYNDNAMTFAQHHFYKYHGLGNDFILFEGSEHFSPEEVIALCDRHRGIGADGVLFITQRNSLPYMRVINSDGSIPEMCGNGIRCAAFHIRRTETIADAVFQIDTDAGIHEVKVKIQSPTEAEVQVQMQTPSFEASAILLSQPNKLIDQEFCIEQTPLKLTAVSMGNPHAVCFDDISKEQRIKLAPQIQNHELFPKGANVGFAQVLAAQHLRLHVYERGAGWTQACGTGACAAAAAAVQTKRADGNTSIQVDLPGGSLHIQTGKENSPTLMRGPAVLVFEGSSL
ncbi:MAG: diaminopimelate epimerase [Myxococcales bacterium]|nr:MAG: diaminopimelate epimerase [Myxococcales bacterium]